MSGQQIFDRLLASIPDGHVESVNIGPNWTAVVVEASGKLSCGLASSMETDDSLLLQWKNQLISNPDLIDARQLAQLVHSKRSYEVSIGMAAINALVPRRDDLWTEVNADEVIANLSAGKKTALVGHFPFVSRLIPRVGQLWVLEQNPGEGDLPASDAPHIIPQADVLAITAMTLMNGTFDELIALKKQDALAILIGPSTPLSLVLFNYGISILSGAVVQDIDNTIKAVMAGANFRQLHQQGVKLVTMVKDGLNLTNIN